MNGRAVLLTVIVVRISLLIFGGLASERINTLVRNYIPNFYYDGETFLLWGLTLWAVFAIGIVALYWIMKP